MIRRVLVKNRNIKGDGASILTCDKSNRAVITRDTRPALCFHENLGGASSRPARRAIHHARPIQYWIRDIKVPELSNELKHYIISLSRKLNLPKSLSFGAIKWSLRALASFIKRNSLLSLHSINSVSPCASLHRSPSVQVPLRNLKRSKPIC